MEFETDYSKQNKIKITNESIRNSRNTNESISRRFQCGNDEAETGYYHEPLSMGRYGSF
ncbi:hypothetical protein GCM10011532_06830 [Christiangramia forsetii]|uniref:Uncharacterized protein n=1 Tax=Christiangramia forsetii TaxID=411153 RepID=A0ABQ1WE38_9FLAO|nr:hypothetical protein GCM10011532_06830 [Christiangramia forsetii]